MDKVNKSRIGIIILAAGASTRLGKPKQLLDFQGKSLIRRAAENALAAECEITAVVLGANFHEIKKKIEDLPVEILVNKNQQSGMGSSVKAGLEKLLEIEPNLSSVILMLCDQPLVNTASILRLVKTQHETRKKIAASEYKKTLGVPAIFSRELFDELLNLQGDTGAKFLIKKYAVSEVAKVSAPEAAVDVDTAEDYKNLENLKLL
ncbi:MAG: nucleotidyltransferase family protein [Pyrinomonadaceae bacterium]